MILFLIALAAFVAGALNAAAGGGTFLTFPLLTGVARLTEKAANVTSTVGLWPGTVSSIVAAWAELRAIAGRVLAGYAAVGFVGGALGAVLLLTTSPSAFAKAIPWLLGFATIVFACGRRVAIWAGRGDGPSIPRFTPRVLPLLLVIALYNGYFGAGGGILLMAGLSLAGLHDLRQINALKVVIQTTSNASAVVAFIAAGVDWRIASVMAAASFAGGYAGMHAARRVPQTFVRALVLFMGMTLTVAYFVKNYR